MSVRFYSPCFNNNSSYQCKRPTAPNSNNNNEAANFLKSFLNDIEVKYSQKTESNKNWSPSVDVRSDESIVEITAELPGVKKDQISLEIKDNILTLSGEKIVSVNRSFEEEKSQESPAVGSESTESPSLESESPSSPQPSSETVSKEEKENEQSEQKPVVFKRTEISYGKFKRTFKLPSDIDLDSIQAKHEDGVLNITIKRIKPITTKILIQ